MKKGFTLVELLGVIFLLALVMLITYPVLIEQFEKKELEISKAKLELISSAAKNYAKLNLEGDKVCVFINDLIEENLIAIDVNDLDAIKKTPVVDLTINDNNNYSATLKSTCTNYKGEIYKEKTCTKSVLENSYTIYDYQNYYFINGILIKEKHNMVFKNIKAANDASYLNAINNYVLLSNMLKVRDGINSYYTKGESDSEVLIVVDYLNEFYNTTLTLQEQAIISNVDLFIIRPKSTVEATINNHCN